MTNGGLETTSSNSSPATGSSRDPSRRLTRASRSAGSRCSSPALSSRLNRVNARARSEMSVAVTCSAWCSRWKVWMPQPVPRSRALATCRRAVTWTRVVEACPIPRTWSWRRTPGRWWAARSLATQRSAPPLPVFPLAVGLPAVRPQVHLRLDQARPRRLHKPQFQQALGTDAGEGGVERRRGLRFGQQPEAHDAGERRRRRAFPRSRRRLGDDQGGDELVAAQGGVRGLAEQLRNAVHGVANGAQVRGQGLEQAGEVAARERRGCCRP